MSVRSLSLCLWTLCLLNISCSAYVLQSIHWTTCPEGQFSKTFKTDCAYLQNPLSYSNLALGNITSFIRRVYVSAPTDVSIWFIAGGPGFSTMDYIPYADYFIMSDPSFTAYLMDARGTGLSSRITCEDVPQPGFGICPYNDSTAQKIFDDCYNEFIAKHSSVAPHYNTHNAALDLQGAIESVNPPIVHIFAASYGTYSANIYLSLPNARATTVVLDGPIPPNRWPMENSAVWCSQVSQDLLNLCATESSVCEGYIGSPAHLPRLVMDAIIDGTLPCIQKVPWLSASTGQIRAATYTNHLTSIEALLAPFWLRLYRCSDSDVTELIQFDSVRQAEIGATSDPIDFSFGLGTNIMVNELYSFGTSSVQTLTYDQQLVATGRVLSTGCGELAHSYAKYKFPWPKYTPNPETYLKFASPTYPVLILVGTLDSNTENGLGKWFKDGLGSFATLLHVPYANHGTFAYDAPCVDSIVVEFFSTKGVLGDTSCLNDLLPPDFDGSENITQELSKKYFGTSYLWGGNSRVEDTTATNKDDCLWTGEDVRNHVLYAAVPMGLAIIALIIWIIVLHRSIKSEDERSLKLGDAAL